MIKELLEGLTAAGLILGFTVLSFFQETKETTEIIHVWTFKDKTFDEDDYLLIDGDYEERI